MKKFYQLDPDQRIVRVVAIISIILGIVVAFYYFFEDFLKNRSFSWELLGLSIFFGLICAITFSFVVITALMRKEKQTSD